MDINPEYIEVAEDIINLLGAKKREVIAHMSDTEAHNFKIDVMIAAYVKSDLKIDLTLTKQSTDSDKRALADLNRLNDFVRDIFQFDPPSWGIEYASLARAILKYMRIELSRHTEALESQTITYVRAHKYYTILKDQEESKWGTSSQKEPNPINPRYKRAVDHWSNAILLATEVFISRGIPQV